MTTPESMKQEVIKLIKSIPVPAQETCTFIIDPVLSSVVSLVIDSPALSAAGAKPIAFLGTEYPLTKNSTVIFVIRPTPESIKLVIKSLDNYQNMLNTPGLMDSTSDSTSSSKKKRGAEPQTKRKLRVHIALIPRVTTHAENLLEESGYFARNFTTYNSYSLGNDHIFALHMHSLDLDMFPLDKDLFTMQLDKSFIEYHLDGVHSSLFYVARAIHKLETIYGKFPNFKCIGKAADKVWSIYSALNKLNPPQNNKTTVEPSKFSEVIIFDRKIDTISPLVTQLTYEGLVDEIFGINTSTFFLKFTFHLGFLKVDPAILEGKEPVSGAKLVSYQLSTRDPLFASIRDQNMGSVGAFLSNKVKNIGSKYKKGKDVGKMELSQISELVSDLSSVHDEAKVLPLHVSIVEALNKRASKVEWREKLEFEHDILDHSAQDIPFLQNYMNRPIPNLPTVTSALRLFSLYSQIHGGIKNAKFDLLATDFCSSFGYKHIVTLNRLTQLDLISRRTGSAPFKQLRKTLNLTVEYQPGGPPSPYDVFSGYAPISSQLIHRACLSGINSLTEVFRVIQAPLFEKSPNTTPVKVAPNPRKQALIVFVGGVTFAEISALRISAASGGTDYTFLTTSMINGNSFLNQLIGVNPS